jgi:glycosyltransferase involved in cell wall biosynthesis
VRISVVVPTRGRPVALLDCIEALQSQEPPEGGFEVVVVADGDGLPSLPEDVRVVAGEGAGPAAARNRGVEAARGEVIAFTDDDCRPSPRWLRELDAELRRGRAAGVAGTTVNGLPEDAFASASQLVLDTAYECFSRGGEPGFAGSANLAMLAADLRALGGYDRSFRISEDRDLCARWLASGRRLAWAPSAEVAHCREMGLASFVRQHTAYGRGAYAVRKRATGSGIVPRPQLRFAFALARRVRRAPGRRLRLAALCALTQVATAAGYVLEAAATRWGLGPRTCLEPALQWPTPSAPSGNAR